jgi:hypothetical protein
MNSVHLKGADELDRVLAMLPEEIGRKVLDRAVLEGARVVAREMKMRAPVGEKAHESVSKKGRLKAVLTVRKPGFLKRNVRARMARPREYGAIARLIGHNRFVTAAIAGVSSRAFYARFVEWGWVLTSRKGRRIRFIGPKPFLRPAWDATRFRALETVGRTLAAGIEQAAARLAGRYRTGGFSSRGRTFLR